MFRYIPILLLLCACGSTIPQIVQEQVDTSPIVSKIEKARADAAQATLTLSRQLAQVKEEALAAKQAADAAALTARKAVAEAAKKPKTILKTKLVPAVVDQIFTPGDRDALLKRADEAVNLGGDAVAKVQQLKSLVAGIQAKLEAAQAFSDSPQAFVEKHGPTGILGVMFAALVAYIFRKKVT